MNYSYSLRFCQPIITDGIIDLFTFLSRTGDHIPSIVRELNAYGHPVTMISPDPTSNDTVGNAIVQLERIDRLADLRARGIRVLDWADDDAFETALDAAIRRWTT